MSCDHCTSKMLSLELPGLKMVNQLVCVGSAMKVGVCVEWLLSMALAYCMASSKSWFHRHTSAMSA